MLIINELIWYYIQDQNNLRNNNLFIYLKMDFYYSIDIKNLNLLILCSYKIIQLLFHFFLLLYHLMVLI